MTMGQWLPYAKSQDTPIWRGCGQLPPVIHTGAQTQRYVQPRLTADFKTCLWIAES